MIVRAAVPDTDAAAIAAVYAQTGVATAASMEERAPDAPEMAGRIRTITGRYPWLVAELDGAVAGYAYATEHRWRSAYRWAADVTVYVSPAHHRQGVGRSLYGALLPALRQQGLHSALAGITLPNPGSVGLHQAFGFELVGVYRDIGFKLGRWHSVGWYQLRLREPPGDGAVPSEPRPPGPGRRPGQQGGGER